jgi:N4-gp56 family major capsid protein
MSQQLFMTNSLGGYLTNNKLSKEVRHLAQPVQKFRQFAQIERAAGKKGGDKVFYDKFSNVATQGGTLTETSTIPKTNITLTQGTLTLVEYGNSVNFTEKLQTLGDIGISENLKMSLANDQSKVLDSAAGVQFQAADYKAVCRTTASTAITSNGVASETATANMSDKNVRDIIDEMRKLNIPAYDNSGNYICIASVNSIRGLYDFFESKAQNTTMTYLAQGEVGMYYGCRFIMETNLLVNNKGGSYGEAVFFGNDAVRQGLALTEEIRIKIPNDFGRDQGLAWYGIMGFQKVWDFTTDGDARIIHVTSA